jgi:hypothetical protein
MNEKEDNDKEDDDDDDDESGCNESLNHFDNEASRNKSDSLTKRSYDSDREFII